MSARVLASIFAAFALLGSLPLWWVLTQPRAGERADTVSASPVHEATMPDPAPSGHLADAGTPPVEPALTEPVGPAPTPDPAPILPERPERPTPELVTGPDPGRSPLADRLNAPDGTIEGDLAILRNVLHNYVIQFGANPVGSNREITAQLSGRNATRHAPLPGDHGAISPEGELLDRWGTPFFFHALEAREMEIRSAGPDRELYTDDDVLTGPQDKRPAPLPSAASAGG